MEKEIDLFALKIYALLMCCGKSETKASILFDLVVGKKGTKSDDDKITWKNPRLQLSVKKLVYFAEIFPKKYR